MENKYDNGGEIVFSSSQEPTHYVEQSAVSTKSAIASKSDSGSVIAISSSNALAQGGAIEKNNEATLLDDTDFLKNKSIAQSTSRATTIFKTNQWSGGSAQRSALSTATANSLSRGGAIFHDIGDIELSNSNIEENSSNALASSLANSSAVMQTGMNIMTESYTSSFSIANGGAIYNHSADIILTNSTISNNKALSTAIAKSYSTASAMGTMWSDTDVDCFSTALSEGGAIYDNGGEINLRSTNISNNSSTASAVLLGYASATGFSSYRSTIDNAFVIAKSYGGGVALISGTGVFTDVSFSNNTAEANTNVDLNRTPADFNKIEEALGGAIYLSDSKVILDDITFNENNTKASISNKGGAVYIGGTSIVSIANTSFNGNKAMQGGAVYVDENSSVTISDSSFLTISDTIYNAGTLSFSGKISLAGTISTISNIMANDSLIIYDFTNHTIGNNDFIINDLNKIKYADFAINVTNNQNIGTYNLADNIGYFNESLVLNIDNFDTKKELSIGTSKIYNQKEYLLTEELGALKLTVSVASSATTKNDFNESGISDISLFDSDNRTFFSIIDIPSGSFSKIQIDSPVIDESWSYLGTGYIDADNVQDVLWINDNGDVGTWLIDGSTKLHQTIAGVTNEWNYLGMADVTGDGRDNIIWQHATGTVLAWESNLDGSYHGDIVLGGVNPNEWQFGGLGDFNNDDKDNVLWVNKLTGITGFWSDNANTFEVLGGVDVNDWQIAGVGDFDNNGFDDVLWQHSGGTLGYWATQSDLSVEWQGIGSSTEMKGFSISAIGDYNGDGNDDVLWSCNTDESYKAWTIKDGKVDILSINIV